jgi:hypothetical protein
VHEWNENVYTPVQTQNFGPPMRDMVQNTKWDKAWLKRGNSVIHYEQLIPFFERLDAGLPITVVGLGSSIVAGGGCFNDRSQLYSLVRHVRTRLNPEFCEPHGWIGSFMSDLNKTWPHKDHVYINLGQPGGDIAQYARHWCFTGTLPRETDLFLVEDHGGNTFWEERGTHVEQIFIQLHHRGRGRRDPPMVFVTTAFAVDIWKAEWKTPVPVERFSQCLETGCANADLCADYATSVLTPKTYSTFGDAGEDSWTAVMHWYGYSVLSVRNIFATSIRDRLWGMSACALSHLFYQDPIHPGPVGTRLYANLLVNHVQEAYAWYKSIGVADLHRRHTPRTPVNPNGWAVPIRKCYDVETSTGIPVTESRGWAWNEETRPGHVNKPGWTTTQAGAELVIDLSTRVRPRSPNEPAVLTLKYLASYDSMGVAALRCADECTCEQITISASHASHASIEVFASTNITQVHACRLVLTNVSPHDGLKWKLLGLTLETFMDPQVDLDFD